MQEIILEYVFNFGFYAITFYLALLLMEKLGKKEPGQFRSRVPLVVIWAGSTTFVQIILEAIRMVYSNQIH